MNKENKNYLSLKDNEKMIKRTLGASNKYCEAAEKLGISEISRDLAELE